MRHTVHDATHIMVLLAANLCNNELQLPHSARTSVVWGSAPKGRVYCLLCEHERGGQKGCGNT